MLTALRDGWSAFVFLITNPDIWIVLGVILGGFGAVYLVWIGAENGRRQTDGGDFTA